MAAGADDGGHGGRAKTVVAVALVLAAGYVLATLGVRSALGLVLLVVFGVATLVGRAIPRAHGWVALGGVGLVLLGVAVATLSLVAADDPWADLILVLWMIALGTVGVAWGAGVWLGCRWRGRRAASVPDP